MGAAVVLDRVEREMLAALQVHAPQRQAHDASGETVFVADLEFAFAEFREVKKAKKMKITGFRSKVSE